MTQQAMKVDIKKYAAYFHDGDIRKIEHQEGLIILEMESAELLPEWNEDGIELSKNNRISGKLYLKNIIKFNADNDLFSNGLYMESRAGDVYTFEILDNKVILTICWMDYSSTQMVNPSPWVTYEIIAENIYWENMPTLSDEYWEMLENEYNASES